VDVAELVAGAADEGGDVRVIGDVDPEGEGAGAELLDLPLGVDERRQAVVAGLVAAGAHDEIGPETRPRDGGGLAAPAAGANDHGDHSRERPAVCTHRNLLVVRAGSATGPRRRPYSHAPPPAGRDGRAARRNQRSPGTVIRVRRRGTKVV